MQINEIQDSNFRQKDWCIINRISYNEYIPQVLYPRYNEIEF